MGFLDHIINTGCSSATRNQRLAAIRSYFHFAAEKNIALSSIFLVLDNIKESTVPEPSRPCLSIDNITAILSQPDVSTLKGIRDSTMLITLYDSATRIDELLALQVGNVSLDGDNSHIRVMGKGSKERVISICDNTASHLSRYFSLYRSNDNPDTDLVFYTVHKGIPGKMTSRNVQLFIQKYADMARVQCPDIPERVHPHMFRRARATLMYQNGVALPLVSRMLGHANLSTTTIYATPSMEMMRNAMSSSRHPSTAKEKRRWALPKPNLTKAHQTK
jgi:site-specific recombinase XerD